MSVFHLPTKIIYGPSAVTDGARELAALGTKAFVVTGRSSAKTSGALGDVVSALEQAGTAWALHDRIRENPTAEMVNAAADDFRESGADFVVGIGGGSPMDAAKAVAAIAASDLTGTLFFEPDLVRDAYPVACVPITAGTGSEVTQHSVITDPASGKKGGFGIPAMFPRVSFIDYRYTLTMPAALTRDTAMDALSHLLEGMYSTRRTAVARPFIFSGVKMIYENLKPCLAEPGNLACREKLMLASLYGGMAIAQTGTTLQHALGYPMTTFMGLSHGLTNALFLKEIMDLYWPVCGSELSELFSSLGVSRNGFYAWIDSFELARGVSIPADIVEGFVDRVMEARNIAITPVPVTREIVFSLYKKLC
ncbi:MAG TPA: iron-containing alcohol dehydrogenase [Spirochaetota bacterium]|nr:iron-containing alcohol dehydrogenase [Spirochaetota bacterium]HPI87995.1 iron-containing alcohol dehydrogenase [Spirochaetota bacterium]HPR46705.1 iron-containing alcohol dehydrogenase [Spirochaetota bacterium]